MDVSLGISSISTGLIFVSALIQPSRILLVMVVAQCVVIAAVGVLLGIGIVGDLTYVVRLSIALVCLLAALCGIVIYYRGHRPIGIDISSVGQIRLTEMPFEMMVASHATAYSPQEVRLLSGSTLWARLLLLRFQLNVGKVRTVVILPDCVPDEVFRALSIACRWIAARTHVVSLVSNL